MNGSIHFPSLKTGCEFVVRVIIHPIIFCWEDTVRVRVVGVRAKPASKAWFERLGSGPTTGYDPQVTIHGSGPTTGYGCHWKLRWPQMGSELGSCIGLGLMDLQVQVWGFISGWFRLQLRLGLGGRGQGAGLGAGLGLGFRLRRHRLRLELR